MILDHFEQLLSVHRISEDTNFWKVRSKRGFFFDEFELIGTFKTFFMVLYYK